MLYHNNDSIKLIISDRENEENSYFSVYRQSKPHIDYGANRHPVNQKEIPGIPINVTEILTDLYHKVFARYVKTKEADSVAMICLAVMI